MTLHVRVDGDRCHGHSRCYDLCPELFDVDDLGYAHEIGDGAVPDALVSKARLAVANCPEQAIDMFEEGD